MHPYCHCPITHARMQCTPCSLYVDTHAASHTPSLCFCHLTPPPNTHTGPPTPPSPPSPLSSIATSSAGLVGGLVTAFMVLALKLVPRADGRSVPEGYGSVTCTLTASAHAQALYFTHLPRRSCPAGPLAPPPPPSTPSSIATSSAGLVGGLVTAFMVLAFGAGGAFVWYRRRMRARRCVHISCC
jgi:hypothetical protein